MHVTIIHDSGLRHPATIPATGLAALVRGLGRNNPGKRVVVAITGGAVLVVREGAIVASTVVPTTI